MLGMGLEDQVSSYCKNSSETMKASTDQVSRSTNGRERKYWVIRGMKNDSKIPGEVATL